MILVRSKRMGWHLFSPGKWGIVIADRVFGVRFALMLFGRYRIVWRYDR